MITFYSFILCLPGCRQWSQATCIMKIYFPPKLLSKLSHDGTALSGHERAGLRCHWGAGPPAECLLTPLIMQGLRSRLISQDGNQSHFALTQTSAPWIGGTRASGLFLSGEHKHLLGAELLLRAFSGMAGTALCSSLRRACPRLANL